MNILKGTRFYLIGQLQYQDFSYTKSWRNYVIEQLRRVGIKFISPLDHVFLNREPEIETWNKLLQKQLKMGLYDQVHEAAKEIRARDLRICDTVDAAICVLNPEIPTFGTVDEIITLSRQLKPIFLIIPEKGYEACPIWLCSYFKPEWVYSDIDHVINTIKKIDLGETEINNKYWKILKEEYR